MKEIEINQQPYSRKIVVDGWIESGDFAHVLLSLSSPFISQYDSVSIRSSFLNYAKITLNSSTGEEEILTLFKDNTYFPPYVYRSLSIKGVVGVTYHLKVEAFGQELTSTTTIPEMPDVSGAYFEAKSDTSGIIKVGINTSTPEPVHLFAQTKSAKADKGFHPCFPGIYTFQSKGNNVMIDIYRIREMNFYLTFFKNEYYYNWPESQYSLEDTVLIKVGRVDNQSFAVLNSILNDRNNNENPFTFNNTGILSNINGGLGRWTGIGMASLQIAFTKK